MEEKTLFVDVILTLHLPSSFRYRVPRVLNDKIAVGQMVVVQFGRKKIYSAIVVNITEEVPKTYTAKYILDIIDLSPIVTQNQITFFSWIASYYVAYIGDVLSAALPSSFRLKSETILQISPYFLGDISLLDQEEQQIFLLVSQKGKANISDLQDIFSQQKLLSIIANLIKKDVLITDEELKNIYTSKKESCIRLCEPYSSNEKERKTLFEKLDSKPGYASQNKVMLTFFSLMQGNRIVKISDLIEKKCSNSSIQTLIKKGVLEKYEIEVSRLKELLATKQVNEIILNQEQLLAYNQILEHWQEYPVSLLYGVTGSGKTEVYIKLIDHVIRQGGQVLYLIPEIAITSQLIQRLEKYFGNRIGVYNSKYSIMERAEVWQRCKTEDKQKRFNIILGSRSAVFLPFKDLQLVIIDEQHDASFKQSEPVPHYNGKDAAMYLAKLFNAKTLLASATPSVESFYLAQEGKYQLLKLEHRYSKTLLPEIFIADIKEYSKQRAMYGIFTKMLYDAINECLENKKQVIIFQNRRGFAPRIKCNICGYEAKCPNCDVSLVLHKHTHNLVCHYCGYSMEVLSACPQCHSHSLRTVGIGTEKIEEELGIYFPKARVSRMDIDSTRQKDAYTKIIKDFASGETDILTGTQIVTKGLDFDNVGLVGVVDADALLHYPDFRAYERAFQTLTQVSGRAGRRNQRGKVVIQTYDPYNQILRDVCEHDYFRMYSSQITDRKRLNFPPFCKMIKITLQYKDREQLKNKSLQYALRLKEIFGSRMFGPQEPTIARIRNLYHQEIWLKIENKISYSLSKTRLREWNEEFLAQKENSSLRIYIDVDPV
ncbi:MAG: primosomal protein N' [Bacteroidota bacterium]|nr:primosomal protein N' [Bacteroidota bacterium]